MEIVIDSRLGVTREAVRRWRRRPGFQESMGMVGQAIGPGLEGVRRWADQRPTRAIIKHGGAYD